MFLKSFLILGTSAIVALTIVLLWVAFQVTGPEDEIARARAFYAAGKYGEAIGALDNTERDLVTSGRRELLDDVWRLRYQAYAAIGTPKGALIDLQNLLHGAGKDDEQLRLEQIRLFAVDGQGPRARLAARAFLQEHPDHSRGLELAGEACQTIYQPMLREVRETFEREISRLDHPEARRNLLAFVYRPDGDPEVERARDRLEALFGRDPRRVAMLPELRGKLIALREQVQEGLGYFERSLEGGDQPVAAFRAVAAALEQSGRIDDLLMACEIQRRRFDHSYVEESGQRAAWARIQAGLPRAAVATVDRWLPRSRIDELIAAGLFGPAHEDLILARSVAAWHLADRDMLDDGQRLINAIREQDVPVNTALHVSLAGRRIERGNLDPDKILQSLDILCKRLLRAPPVTGRPDLGAEFAALRVAFLKGQSASDTDVQAALQEWRDARPDDVEPLVQVAEFLCDTGKTAAAFSALDEAAALAPEHPALFPLRLKTARRHFEGSSQDGPALLAQCAKRDAFEPEVNDPIGYVLCAEAALAFPDWRARRVAAACAQRAVDAFPHANLPRQLELRSLLALERPAEADRAADAALLAVVPDAETFRLAVLAKRAAGSSLRALLRAAMPVVQDAATLAPELVRFALADDPKTAAIFVTPAMTAADAPVVDRLLAIRALAHAGEHERAGALLASVPAPGPSPAPPPAPGQAATPEPTPELLDATAWAYADWLAAVSGAVEDDVLVERAASHWSRLQLGAGPQRALFRVAEQLAETHPRTAYRVLAHALGAAETEERTGAQFALAGRLALRVGLLAQAEEHWTAALGFDDGHVAAEGLTRLLLVQDRDERAARVYGLVRQPTDAALAARFGRLDLAMPLIGAVLQQDPADLVTQATLATFGQSPVLDWKPATEQLQTERLELLACMRDPALSALCTARAQALVADDATSVTGYLLVARTFVDSGQPRLALMLHAQALAGGFTQPVLWREVAYAASTQPGYQPGPALLDRVTVAANKGDTGGSELTRRWGLSQFVAAFDKAGLHDQADQVRVLQWLVAPTALRCTAASLELIATRHTPADACSILDRVLTAGDAEDPRAVLDRFYELAPQALAADPKLRPTFAARAAGHLQRAGALGPVVHFLLSHGDAKTVQPVKLLRAHLAAVASGVDDGRYLQRTVEELRRREGAERTAAWVDAALDEHPTAMPLWGERAKLRARLRDARAALDELRTVLSHAPDPFSTLTFATLAAFERNLEPRDVAALGALPPDLLATREGRFASGLVAMREGRTQKALELLADAPAWPDGRHLYALAFVSLQSPDEGSLARARDALAALERDYPNSSFARHAGSFVRQLSPRAASADDSETNR